MINYSQNKEQEVILNYFAKTKIGNFLDIGANDGETLSNTRALALLGWSGVLVEPTDIAFAKLSNLYKHNKDIVCVKCAVGEISGEVEINVNGNHIGENDTGLLSTTIDKEKERWVGEVWGKEKIKMVTYHELLNIAYGATDDFRYMFDFVSIDAEGCDIDILKQIDLRYVRMVCVEWNSVQENYISINNICTNYGMSLIHKNSENLIYAKGMA